MKLEKVGDLAKKLGVCKPTIYTQIRAGKIPAYRIGRKVLVNYEEVLRAMALVQDDAK